MKKKDPNKVVDRLLKEFENREIKKIVPPSIEYTLGVYIGEYIVYRYLPTLSFDMILSRNVIQVTEEETKKEKELHDAWWDIIGFNKNPMEAGDKQWIELRKFHKEMENKYLFDELICFVPYFNVENTDELIKGIYTSLWDCDFSYYDINGILIEDEEILGAKKITLKRAKNDIKIK